MLRRGQRARRALGTAGEQLKPSWNRCFSVAPERDTTCTLAAGGADGAQRGIAATRITYPRVGCGAWWDMSP
ncbi:MAG: hypothetical protein NT090_26265, partial [Acidobacteria bacterium]|nr:hypothetical protein [Acidobacteriota bacterium]